MLSISLGPIVISVSQLITGLTVGIFWGLTYLQTRSTDCRKDILNNIFNAFVVGFITARLAFVFTMWKVYQENWWQLVNISDGGFLPSYGWLSGALVLSVYSRHNKVAMKPYFISSIVSLFIFSIATFTAASYATDVSLPQSTVRNIQNQKVTLTAYKGKPVVINLWASWCPPCRREMPVLEAAQKNNSDITFMFINQGENLSAIQNFVRVERLNLRNIFLDSASNVSRETGVAGFPTTLFYDKKGQLISSHMGELSQASLHYYLQVINKKHVSK